MFKYISLCIRRSISIGKTEDLNTMVSIQARDIPAGINDNHKWLILLEDTMNLKLGEWLVN